MDQPIVFELVKQRDELEEQLKELEIKLNPLIDAGWGKNNHEYTDSEGFPQENLDWAKLTEYRELKKDWNMKSNDFKA